MSIIKTKLSPLKGTWYCGEFTADIDDLYKRTHESILCKKCGLELKLLGFVCDQPIYECCEPCGDILYN